MKEGIASQIIILSLTGNQTKLKFAQSFKKNSYVFVNKTQVWIKVVDWVETLKKLKKALNFWVCYRFGNVCCGIAKLERGGAWKLEFVWAFQWSSKKVEVWRKLWPSEAQYLPPFPTTLQTLAKFDTFSFLLTHISVGKTWVWIVLLVLRLRRLTFGTFLNNF